MEEINIILCLKKWRLEKSRHIGRPAFTILTDETLNAIVECRPKSKSELLEVKGIGPQKIKLYGEEILFILNSVADVNTGDVETGNIRNQDIPCSFQIIRQGSRYGLSDHHGNIALNCVYTEIVEASPNLFIVMSGIPFQQDGYIKKGDVDSFSWWYQCDKECSLGLYDSRTRKFIILPDRYYIIAKCAEHEIYQTWELGDRTRGLKGCMSTDGKILLDNKYTSLVVISRDKYIVKYYNKMYLAGRYGKRISRTFDKMYSPSDGMILCWSGQLYRDDKGIMRPQGGLGTYSYIDIDGNEMDALSTYVKAGAFHYGYAAVFRDGYWGYIDKRGNKALPFNFLTASSVMESDSGLYVEVSDEHKNYRMDLSGKILYEEEIEKEPIEREDYSFSGWSKEELEDAYRGAFEGDPEAEWNID